MSAITESQMAETALQRHTGPGYRILDSVEERLLEERLDGLRRQLGTACAHFPYIAHRTVTVGCREDIGEEHSRWTPYASAESINHLIRIPVEEHPSNQTIFHEIAHLEIYERSEDGANVPETSEEFCSIYAVARMPPEWVVRDSRNDIAYLGEPTVARKRWPVTCRHALEYRDRHRNYIQQCKEWLGIGGDA